MYKIAAIMILNLSFVQQLVASTLYFLCDLRNYIKAKQKKYEVKASIFQERAIYDDMQFLVVQDQKISLVFLRSKSGYSARL